MNISYTNEWNSIFLVFYLLICYNIRLFAIMDSEKYKKIRTQINKGFFYLDLVLTVLCAIMSFASISNRCLVSFYFFYAMFFFGQASSHYVILKIPNIDAIKFSTSIKRLIIAVGIIQISYLLLTIVFWEKN